MLGLPVQGKTLEESTDHSLVYELFAKGVKVLFLSQRGPGGGWCSGPFTVKKRPLFDENAFIVA